MVDKKGTRKSRLGMRIAILVGGACVCGLYMYITNDNTLSGTIMAESDTSENFDSYFPNLGSGRRQLLENDPLICRDPTIQPEICIGYGSEACKRLATKDLGWLAVIVLALLYLFVGIAIVCDELFVPALEIIAEDLELSNDVAGATLMAAGGSAPELATSFVGTFKRSDVGFGTIVGSAVFNVLFVIGMCVMFTPPEFSPLKLTWWPLFRDCTYYVLTLVTLAIFMYDGVIEIWEACIQFAMYFGYVAMMSKSEKIESWLNQKFSKNPSEQQVAPDEGGTEMADLEAVPQADIDTGSGITKEGPTASFTRPSTFRVGILQLLTATTSISDTAGVAFVSKIKGDVNVVFEKIDANQNGSLEKDELKTCLLDLGTPESELTEEKIDECMSQMDTDGKGYCTKAQFTVWYTGNEQRLKNQTRSVFDRFDTDKSPPQTILRADVCEFMKELGHGKLGEGQQKEIEEASLAIPSTCKDESCLTYEDFATWYESSLFWEHEKTSAEQAAESQESMWDGVLGGFSDLFDSQHPTSSKVNYLITLPLSLIFCLIPDCRPPGKEGLAAFTLVGSIIMIALFAIVMVELAEIFGKSVGIPDVVMGLTILAAGTSVPDLLSSVIVAQQGQGDMAVSSSIGSNIFDVAFGLPLPWLVFNIVTIVNDCKCRVVVASDGLFSSLLILLVMVGAIVVIIHYSNWEMTHALGYAMFSLYFIYVGVSLLLTPAKDFVLEPCSPFAPF